MSWPGVYARPWKLILTDSDGQMFASIPFKADKGRNIEAVESPEVPTELVLRAYVSVPLVGRVDTKQSYSLRKGQRLVIDPGAIHVDIMEAG